MIKKSLILLFLIAGLFSCITQGRRSRICATCPVTTEVVTVRKDSVWTKEVVKHDTIYQSVPGPTIVLPGPCDKLCDKNGKLKAFHQETKKNGIDETITSDVKNNDLVVTCKEDSLKKVNEIHEKTINHLIQQITTVTKQKPPIEVNRLTWIQQFFIHTSYFFWLILLIFVGYKVAKTYLKIPKP